MTKKPKPTAIKEQYFYYDGKSLWFAYDEYESALVIDTFFKISSLECNEDRSINVVKIIFEDIWGREKQLTLDRGNLANQDLTMKILYTEGLPYCKRPDLLLTFMLKFRARRKK